jgi:hypothetical protein
MATRKRSKPKTSKGSGSADIKSVWCGFARDAAAIVPRPTEADELQDSLDLVLQYADDMLEEYEWRFANGPQPERQEDADDEDEDPEN